MFFSKLFRKSKNTNDDISVALSTLVQSHADVDSFFEGMAQKGISAEISSRLYNLILLACGRVILSGGESAPMFPDHYVVRETEEINFNSCPIYTKISQHIGCLNHDTVLALGVLSCEMQSFNACLNELEKKLGTTPTPENISQIQLYPPKLPC